MRIALCFSGVPRTWKQAFPTVERYFAGHEIDTYLHFWDDKPKSAQEAAAVKAERAEMIAVMRPRAVIIKPRPDYDDCKREMKARYAKGATPFSFDMFAANKLSLQPALAQGGYDAVVRLRYDSVFDGAFPASVSNTKSP